MLIKTNGCGAASPENSGLREGWELTRASAAALASVIWNTFPPDQLLYIRTIKIC